MMLKWLLLVSMAAHAAPSGKRCECECWKTPKRRVQTAEKLCPVSSEIVERTVGNYKCEPDWLVRKEADNDDACRVFEHQVCNGYTMGGERMRKTKGRLKGCSYKNG